MGKAIEREEPMTERTLPRLFEDSVAKYPDNVLMWEKTGDAYSGTNYREMRERVRAFAAGLMGLGPGQGRPRRPHLRGPERLGHERAGHPLRGGDQRPRSRSRSTSSPTSSSGSPTRAAGWRSCRASQVEKIRQIKNDLADLEKTIVLDQLRPFEPDEIFAGDVLAEAKEWLAAHGPEFEARWHPSGERSTPTSATPRERRPTPRASS